MRDGLSLLDQSIAFGGGKWKGRWLRRCSGASIEIMCCGCLRRWRSTTVRRCWPRLRSSTKARADYAAVLDELLEALQRIAVLQLVGGRVDDEEFAAVMPFVAQFSPEDAQLYYQIALHGRRDLPIGREPRMGFEMTLLRMLAFRPPPRRRS